MSFNKKSGGAGAVKITDEDVSSAAWFLDEDDFVSDSDVKVPSQQSTKAYIDAINVALQAGMIPRDGVVTVAKSNIALTGDQNIANVQTGDNKRIGVVGQTDPIENGIYISNSSGAWTRATDFDGSPTQEVRDGVYFTVVDGDFIRYTYMVINSGAAVTVDTDPITFTETPGQSGLNNTIDLDISAGGNFLITAASGYQSNAFQTRVRLIGTISANTTIEMPPITAVDRYIEVKDATGNGQSSPEYTLKIVPNGSDTIDETVGSTNEFELDTDYQSQGFYSSFSNTKWEA